MSKNTFEASHQPMQFQEMQYDSGHGSRETDSLRQHHSSGRGTILNALASWRLETFSLLAGIGDLVAIFLILDHFNGEDVPSWPVSLNLNSLIAILTTLLRAFLIFPIAEVISQEKWFWFSRPRPLRHLDAFDLGSRGIWGSAKLMLIAYSSAVPFIAAITTIILLAIGPFSQQAIRTDLCLRIVETQERALIPVAARIPRLEESFDTFGQPRALSAETMNSVLAGLTTPEYASETNLGFQCTTGNCTFPAFGDITYSSLGLCSSCEDLTSMVTQSPKCPSTITGKDDYTQCEYLFAPPNAPNVSIDMYTRPFRIETSGAWVGGVGLKTFDFFNVSILTRSLAGCRGEKGELGCPSLPNLPELSNFAKNRDFNFSMVAARCLLYPCIKHFHGFVRNGRLTERVVKAVKLEGNYTGTRPRDVVAVSNPCFVGGEVYDSSNMSIAAAKYGEDIINTTARSTAPRPCVYKITNSWMQVLGERINETLTGSCQSLGHARHTNTVFTTIACPEWWLSGLWNNQSTTFDIISERFSNVSAAVTNRVRSIGLVWDSAAASDLFREPRLETDRLFATGTTLQDRLCIQVDWRWLLLPTGLTFVTLALLLVSILRTYWKGGVVWKSSVLPLLFHGFRDKVDGMPPDHRLTLQEMKKKADGVKVMYAADDYGGCGMTSR
ncbi:hypothetical protein QBC34DRAFT_442160 [Podospora aff. communis PSN243]|uniref:Carboxylic ester hydrolase n=1 Tax=Podospora aff. communis PSN243 TaxID=3040156 RepID=A0AAV9GA23_9PEZI|nr:hypothetical protein QBC34DRAFT_442160 [Podospora aff. communis PSN243]